MNIVLALIVFTILVLIHELGHFLTAKRLGIKAYELAIGMGPKIFGKKVGETEYTLRAIPFGAYVRFSDEGDELDENDVETAELDNKQKTSFFAEVDNFMEQSPWKRIQVVFMGPLVNIAFAILIMICVFYVTGFPSNKLTTLPEGMPAYEAGLEAGDRILQVGYTDTDSWEDIYSEISKVASESKPIRFQVEKSDGQIEEIYVQPVMSEGRLVVGIAPAYEKNVIKSVVYGFKFTLKQSTMMITVIKNLFIGRADINEFSGPVGIVSVVGEATKLGASTFFAFVAMISLNLGIVNLIPIPGLDGSKILIYGYELVTKKQMNRELETKLTIAGFLLLIGFSIFITYKDIVKLVTG